ncbi:MAG: transcription elongation factor GreA [Clostridia bacterium]|nr:transcription elongation factor GreA [Bacillota bacterium]MBO2520856.1 transcription elongation factor GreA [Bacillota bacterium]
MSDKEVLLTPDGLSKLEKELDHLKTVKRREVAARIKQALEFGDISENSEYDDAKNEQAFIEGRIAALEKMLRNARVIDRDEIGTDVVTVGCTVRLKDLDLGEEVEYTLVGSAEADPASFRISNESPVGRAIMGQKVGAVVEVEAPAGTLRYQIVKISR